MTLSEQEEGRPSDEDILAFSQEVQDSAIHDIPLISQQLPLSTLKSEYEHGNQTFLAKIDGLGTDATYYRTRGDGNCFYRAFAFSLIEQCRASRDETESLIDLFTTSQGILEAAGFSALVYEDFLEATVSVTRAPVLLDAMNDAEQSNAVVVFLRLLTSAYIKTHPQEYLPYLHDQQSHESLDRWAERWVEAIGSEADNIQINALVMALNVGVDVVNLDGTPGSRANVHHVRPDSKPDTTQQRVVTVLYRPGRFSSSPCHKVQLIHNRSLRCLIVDFFSSSLLFISVEKHAFTRHSKDYHSEQFCIFSSTIRPDAS